MPLLDNFRPPLSLRRHWHAFHNSWATYLASHLNSELPEEFFAEQTCSSGLRSMSPGSMTVLGRPKLPASSWTVPQPTATLPLTILSDVIEVLVFRQEGGPILAAAMELVSPASKDRPEHRDAFVSKCATLVQQGIGLVLVDVVTDRTADLHRELLHRELLQRVSSESEVESSPLHATAYRPILRDDTPLVNLFHHPARVGEPLPSVPLFLKGGPMMIVDLEATYARTCREQRVQSI